MNVSFDHLVIGAGTLVEGVRWLKQTLGVEIPFGGRHAKMATHNHLMQLGEGMFLEVIAIDPEAPAPDRPRWYGLDDPFIRRQLAEQPVLLGWVVNTNDINALIHRGGSLFGRAERISRGPLNWQFGLPEDGGLPAAGMLPYLIEWESAAHPSAAMADCGCRLTKLEIFHPNPNWLRAELQVIGATRLVSIKELPANSTPRLVATIETEQGCRILSSEPGASGQPAL